MKNIPIIERKTSYDQLCSFCSALIKEINEEDGLDSIIDASLNHIKNTMNEILYEKECTSVTFTNNTDNVMFGIIVNPTITSMDLMTILLDDRDASLVRYSLELDSKLVSILTGEQLAACLVHQTVSVMGSKMIPDVRQVIDITVGATNNDIDIQDSTNYSQILIFGIKDLINKSSNLLYMSDFESIDRLGSKVFMVAFNAEETLMSAYSVISNARMDDIGLEVDTRANVLNWVLMVYKNIKYSAKDAKNTLTDAIQFTGSKTIKNEIDITIKSISRAASEIMYESANTIQALNEKSFFASLKKNGLRQIEDDLYEFKIRSKNCETQDEAIYIIRQINSRVAILDDYISNSEISENERNRWLELIQKFRELREEIGRKKIANKKSYGIFIDYDKIDEE